ncbi:MAG TPA: FAD-binding protein [Acetobacteraceae bacterium]|jgi:glycolate oxidase FAD binding subunit|nr:FAD-binding protein [Acetobacteraceae bacterium]
MSAAEAPGDDAGIAAAIAEAAAAREPLSVSGNGSKQAMLRPVQAARGISTRNLSGITLHSPAELVLSARAGTPLAVIESALAEHGQHLIAEPPDLGPLLGAAAPPTLGGTVAANLSGPRRIAAGAMRDHVLGVRAVNGEGTIIHSGGRVLKNVTGLDLCKLLAGSHGTLAVMTEITLKVLPAPEATGTVAVSGLDAAQGVAALSAALGSPYAVSGAAYLPEAAAARLSELGSIALGRISDGIALARIEDFAPSVAYRSDRLACALARFGPARLIEDAESRRLWRAIRDALPLPAAETDAVWRVSVRPSAAPRLAATLAAMDAGWFLDWGGGLLWVAAPADTATHRAITRAATEAGGAWMLLRAPEALRASLPVLPPPPPVLARLTRRVKAAFDPHGILNPGRMYAGI